MGVKALRGPTERQEEATVTDDQASEGSETPETPEDDLAPQDSPNRQEYLTNIDLDLVWFIERFHASNGEAPTDKQIQARYSEVTDEMLRAFKNNPLVTKSMAARGIPYPRPTEKFTQRQMAAVAAMLAYTDRRSDEKKLRDIGVTPREWAGWLQDENFANYLRDRSERMAANSLHEAHLGLIKGIRNGNTASIKLYYEMTGRYNPEQENQINVRLLLHKFIEVIQKYVKDPLTLHNIAADLSSIASRESYNHALTRTIIQDGGVQPSATSNSYNFGAISEQKELG